MKIPYGIGIFELDNGVTTYQPTGKHYTMKEEPDCQVDIHRSPFTGKRWAVNRDSERAWEITIFGISLTEFDELMAYKGDLITFTPHIDEDTITYECIVTYVDHLYFNGRYQYDAIVIKIVEQVYLTDWST